MPVDELAPTPPEDAGADARRRARQLMRTALKGTLATLERDGGHPYASLVLTATEPDAAPILLISRLALHTRNLERDPRASLLLDGTDGLGDPLTGGRLTLTGEMRPTASATARRRFLARHPTAAAYAQFADFAMFALVLARAHWIGGFGRIVDLAPADLLTDTAGAERLIAAESEILAHMNEEHAEAVALYAHALCGAEPGAWRMVGIDPEGADLLHCSKALRLPFPHPVDTPGAAREVLVALLQQARERPGI